MSSYDALAASYDALTVDVEYRRRADYLTRQFHRSALPVETVLDLACGTGTMACLLAERGYRMIAVDGSEEMLTQAAWKAAALEQPPMFLHQSMPRLHLGMEVDAAISTLDALNYLTRTADLRETLRRVYRWLRPGGLFLFDVNTPYKLRRMDGQVYLDETEDSYCVWRTFYAPGRKICTYQVDLFRLNANGSWDRAFEEHRERAWGREELETYLTEAGFGAVTVTGDLTSRPPAAEEDRWIFRCQKPVRPRYNRSLYNERSVDPGHLQGWPYQGHGSFHPGAHRARPSDPQGSACGHGGAGPDAGCGLHDGQRPEGGRGQRDAADQGRRPAGNAAGGVR